MIAHVVLFSPRADLADADRRDLLQALARASHGIPSVRSFRVGRRIVHGLPGYEQAMQDDYEYAAIIEFDDAAGLQAYLAHPGHAAIGAHFVKSAARALAYDYEVFDAAQAVSLLDDA
jgi:hypothetical protein